MSSFFSVVDDHDLDDAELWAVIDSAAASHSSSKSSRNKPLPLRSPTFRSPLPQPSFSPPPSTFHRNPCPRPLADEKPLAYPSDGGEVLQEPWEHHRPFKQPRASYAGEGGNDNRIVVLQRPTPTPTASFYSSPVSGNFPVQEVSPFPVESPSMHSLLGSFPTVNMFKQYQNAAMAILEKSDYTMISGSPFIKKSGWRKISFYFNISFEIKDKSIEFDENRNVQRAEFVVRAYMQGGRFSDSWGSCERREKRFMKPNHDIPSTAETRAKNKACQDLLGIGEYKPGSSNSHR